MSDSQNQNNLLNKFVRKERIFEIFQLFVNQPQSFSLQFKSQASLFPIFQDQVLKLFIDLLHHSQQPLLFNIIAILYQFGPLFASQELIANIAYGLLTCQYQSVRQQSVNLVNSVSKQIRIKVKTKFHQNWQSQQQRHKSLMIQSLRILQNQERKQFYIKNLQYFAAKEILFKKIKHILLEDIQQGMCISSLIIKLKQNFSDYLYIAQFLIQTSQKMQLNLVKLLDQFLLIPNWRIKILSIKTIVTFKERPQIIQLYCQKIDVLLDDNEPLVSQSCLQILESISVFIKKQNVIKIYRKLKQENYGRQKDYYHSFLKIYPFLIKELPKSLQFQIVSLLKQIFVPNHQVQHFFTSFFIAFPKHCPLEIQKKIVQFGIAQLKIDKYRRRKTGLQIISQMAKRYQILQFEERQIQQIIKLIFDDFEVVRLKAVQTLRVIAQFKGLDISQQLYQRVIRYKGSPKFKDRISVLNFISITIYKTNQRVRVKMIKLIEQSRKDQVDLVREHLQSTLLKDQKFLKSLRYGQLF